MIQSTTQQYLNSYHEKKSQFLPSSGQPTSAAHRSSRTQCPSSWSRLTSSSGSSTDTLMTCSSSQRPVVSNSPPWTLMAQALWTIILANSPVRLPFKPIFKKLIFLIAWGKLVWCLNRTIPWLRIHIIFLFRTTRHSKFEPFFMPGTDRYSPFSFWSPVTIWTTPCFPI